MKKLIHILFIVVFVIGCDDNVHSNVKEELFSKDRWSKKGGDLPFNHRISMISDLENNYLSVGMERSKVIDILGPPEYNGERMINYIVLEDDDDFDGDLWTWKLRFLFDKTGQKIIEISYTEHITKDNKFSEVYKAVREYAENHFDTNYTLMEGSVGDVKKFIDEDGNRFYEQKHLGVPIHKDSLTGAIPWTYFQLNSNLEVVSYSRKSKIPIK